MFARGEFVYACDLQRLKVDPPTRFVCSEWRIMMQQGIHPEYKEATVKCACGSVFETKTTTGDYHIDICSSCHPVYTGGTSRLIDTEGRIERFRKKYKKQD